MPKVAIKLHEQSWEKNDQLHCEVCLSIILIKSKEFFAFLMHCFCSFSFRSKIGNRKHCNDYIDEDSHKKYEKLN